MARTCSPDPSRAATVNRLNISDREGSGLHEVTQGASRFGSVGARGAAIGFPMAAPASRHCGNEGSNASTRPAVGMSALSEPERR